MMSWRSISPNPDAPMIVPGFPQIKLAADAAAAISLGQAEVRPQVHPAIDKMQHRLHGGFSGDTVPATRIYVLERGEKAAITPCRASPPCRQSSNSPT